MTPKAYCDNADLQDKQQPKYVKCVLHLKCDVVALTELTAKDGPPDIPVRATNPAAIYLVGDASGRGFGICSWIQGAKEMRVDLRT